MTQLRSLEAEGWLDRRSRAVVVEMTVLNVPTSLFRYVEKHVFYLLTRSFRCA